MHRPWVGLIEDSGSRVSWLRSLVEPHYDVVHSVRVTRFVELVTDAVVERGRPAMLIYDHDLGIGSFEDIDGHNGFDALGQTLGMTNRYLVWSTNDDARRRMREALKRAGMERGTRTAAFAPPYLAQIRGWLRTELKLPGHEDVPGHERDWPSI